MLLPLLVLTLVAVVLAGPVIARTVAGWCARRKGARRGATGPRDLPYDPGRERRAEHRARQLLRSCVNEEEWGMYRDLGFIRVAGRPLNRGRRTTDTPGPPYAYLIYPHRPIVSYVPAPRQLLSEYCVEFPDVSGDGRTRLPASDDVLAKWMALTSDEARVIGQANMHLVGRQLDPQRVRRDLWRLSEWERRRGAPRSIRARSV